MSISLVKVNILIDVYVINKKGGKEKEWGRRGKEKGGGKIESKLEKRGRESS